MSSDDALLKQFLFTYKHPDLTRRQVLNVIQQYKCLSYRLENFVFSNTARRDLLNLVGTIPVNYKGAYYNIPICIWLMDTHPNNAPLCYVKPTPDMSIKTSKYVDENGKVYLPYLHSWNKQSDLLRLIQVMIVAFGELSPVYSKPKTDMKQPPYPMSQYPGNNALPYPAAGYPGATPYPSANTPYPGYPTSSYAPYPNPSGTYNTPYPATPTMPPYPGYPSPGQGTPVGTATGGPSTATGGTITEEHIKASLLSAVEDKLKRRLKEQSQQSFAELETLRRTQEELTEGKNRLDEILQRLQKEQGDLDKNIIVLQEKAKELEESISKLSEQEGIDVDEAVVTTAPLYTQLLNAFAEEATTEDAIYYVGEALRKEVIDLDTFLKQVRILSRKQFSLRAIMLKCRQRAGLAC